MDPLKPLSTIVRSVWDKTVRRGTQRDDGVDSSTTSNQSPQTTVLAASAPVQPLLSRLKARIPTAARWDASQARVAFVETVLLSELGDDLANDNAFSTIVKNISEQLGSDPKLSARLDTLLLNLSQGKSAE